MEFKPVVLSDQAEVVINHFHEFEPMLLVRSRLLQITPVSFDVTSDSNGAYSNALQRHDPSFRRCLNIGHLTSAYAPLGLHYI